MKANTQHTCKFCKRFNPDLDVIKVRNRWMCESCILQAGLIHCAIHDEWWYEGSASRGCMTCARAERKRLGRGEYSPECVANRARAEKELTEPVVNAMPVVIAPADATPEQLAFVEWLNKYRAERA